MLQTLTRRLPLLIAGVLLASPAYAGDTCKDVTLKITNNFRKDVKIVAFEFYDYDKERWREEILKAENNRIDAGESKTYLRNLQGVENDQTRFRITYYKENNYNEQAKVEVDKHRCTSGEIKTLTLE